ncbi:1357_t:CDS:2, partial [Acaulospora morrowiae]
TRVTEMVHMKVKAVARSNHRDWSLLHLINNNFSLSNSSFPEFLFNLLFGSFALNQWKFGQLDLFGKSLDQYSSLQSFIFLIAVGIYAFSKFSRSIKCSKRRGEGSEKTGKIHYGGPFQIVYLFKNFFSSNDSRDTYYDSLNYPNL